MRVKYLRRSPSHSPAADDAQSPAALLLIERDPDRRELIEIAVQLREIRDSMQDHLDKWIALEQMEASLERRHQLVWRRCSERRPTGDSA